MRLRIHIVCAAVGALLFAAQVHAQEQPPVREIGRTTEREVSVVLSSSFGRVVVMRGESEKILIVTNRNEPSVSSPAIQYAIRNRTGYIDLNLGEVDEAAHEVGGNTPPPKSSRGPWELRFSPSVPISFDIELGVGRGDFDLSGLQVKDFNLSTGASDVNVSFDEPNQAVIENMNIESGLSKFAAKNLGNANFRHLRFQGGVGSYTLDFGGGMTSEVDVDIEIGLGFLTIVIPPSVGARVFYEKSWMSSIEVAEDFRTTGDNTYTSDNYTSVAGRMNIRLDSGAGNVRIMRP